ncbi:MAG TPA: hypothetical protein VHT53_02760 [Candidatus Elarobacter sp.]|jgi:hypothetical protein|nr:hypothetical protein [Candidatus Elarobacter sp.]
MTRSLAAAALTASALLAAAPAFASARDDVRASVQKFSQLQSFEMVMQDQGRTMTVDVVNSPAATHTKMPGNEIIFVGGISYMRQGGSWRKFPASSRAPMMENPIRHMGDDANRSTFGAVDLGMKNVGGESLHAYKVADKSTSSAGTLYIGGDGLPHRWEGTDGSVVKLTKFNGVAPIKAPV